MKQKFNVVCSHVDLKPSVEGTIKCITCGMTKMMIEMSQIKVVIGTVDVEFPETP